MKQILLIAIIMSPGMAALSCPACSAQQPRLLRGIIHGAGPDNVWEYGFLFMALLIFCLTLFYSVKWLIRPAEPSVNHIKHFILNDEYYER